MNISVCQLKSPLILNFDLCIQLRAGDPDVRCMAIIDFQKDAQQTGYRMEEAVETQFFKEMLKLAIEDTNSEVRNMGIGG